ncbi:hypothetical protein KHA80_11125 [Anaerobacillus sp. HL2]|nr:hypothetical protein KHA80_11125 [Anaerobacillus sp. HL2]
MIGFFLANAVEAIRTGRLGEEIVPVEIRRKRDLTVVSTDESPREDTSCERLAKLAPVFDPTGTITGNAPGVNDGACALVVMSEDRAKQEDKEILQQLSVIQQL